MFLCRTSKVSLLLFFLLLLLLLCFLSFLYFCLVLNHKFIYVNVCTEFMRANTLSTRIEFYVIYTATIQKYRRHTHTTGTFCSHTHTHWVCLQCDCKRHLRSHNDFAIFYLPLAIVVLTVLLFTYIFIFSLSMLFGLAPHTRATAFRTEQWNRSQ